MDEGHFAQLNSNNALHFKSTQCAQSERPSNPQKSHKSQAELGQTSLGRRWPQASAAG